MPKEGRSPWPPPHMSAPHPKARLWLQSTAGKGGLWCLAPCRYLNLTHAESGAEEGASPGKEPEDWPCWLDAGRQVSSGNRSLVLAEGGGLSRPSGGQRVAFSCLSLPPQMSIHFPACHLLFLAKGCHREQRWQELPALMGRVF